MTNYIVGGAHIVAGDGTQAKVEVFNSVNRQSCEVDDLPGNKKILYRIYLFIKLDLKETIMNYTYIF